MTKKSIRLAYDLSVMGEVRYHPPNPAIEGHHFKGVKGVTV
jgi:hypothetical protein